MLFLEKGPQDSQGWVLGGCVRKSAVYPGRFGDNLEGRTSVLNFHHGAWEYDKIA